MAKGMHSPKLQHLVMAKYALRYLNSHRSNALTYRRNGNLINGLFRTLGDMDGALQSLTSTDYQEADAITLFADSNYATDPETRKSVSGKATYLFGCLTSWSSKRQPVIAGSTHEAETVAMSFVANEGVWQRRLLHELGVIGNLDVIGTKGRLPPTPLLCDNKAATFTANTPSTSERSKHIDVRHMKVREYVANGDIRVVHIGTNYNVSDLFTKGLPIQKFSQFRDLLMGEQFAKRRLPPPLPAFGGGG